MLVYRQLNEPSTSFKPAAYLNAQSSFLPMDQVICQGKGTIYPVTLSLWLLLLSSWILPLEDLYISDCGWVRCNTLSFRREVFGFLSQSCSQLSGCTFCTGWKTVSWYRALLIEFWFLTSTASLAALLFHLCKSWEIAPIPSCGEH